MAADWSFYGSARIATWYADRDYGDGTSTARTTTKPPNGTSRRLPPGAKVMADKVTGRLELALAAGHVVNEGHGQVLGD